eukprot:1139398-Pelagomonas_calceolata.AAC.2
MQWPEALRRMAGLQDRGTEKDGRITRLRHRREQTAESGAQGTELANPVHAHTIKEAQQPGKDELAEGVRHEQGVRR